MYQGIYELLENSFTLFPRSLSANLFKNTVSFSLCLAFSLELAAFNSVTWEIYFLTLFFGNCPFLEICGKSSGEKCEVFSKRETNFDWNHFSNLNFITVFLKICQRFFFASRLLLLLYQLHSPWITITTKERKLLLGSQLSALALLIILISSLTSAFWTWNKLKILLILCS